MNKLSSLLLFWGSGHVCCFNYFVLAALNLFEAQGRHVFVYLAIMSKPIVGKPELETMVYPKQPITIYGLLV